MNSKLKISQLLDPYDSSLTECDGMTRICHTILSQQHVEHQTKVGTLHFLKKKIEPHLWIELGSGEIIDYRAKMWFGNCQQIPHGMFEPDDFPDVIYRGKSIELELLSPALLKILITKLDLT